MIKQINFLITVGAIAFLEFGCVASRVDHFGDYSPDASRPPIHDNSSVEEYYFISWEPYHFILTIGILPQYHYVVYEKTPGRFEKHSTMIGWLAIPLPLTSPWEYGRSQKEVKPKTDIKSDME